MSFDIALVNDFADRVSYRNTVIFCGAGISAKSGLPTWDDLLNDLYTELKVDRGMQDLPLLAQYYCQVMAGGRERLIDMVAKTISADVKPTRTHLLLSELLVREFWTTNYDTLLEQAIPEATIFSSEKELTEKYLGDGQLIFKMHGNRPITTQVGRAIEENQIVITRDDFELYETRYPRFWSLFNAAFLTKNILFIGLSFTDPNIRHILQLARTKLDAPGVRHLAVLKKPTNDKFLRRYEFFCNDLLTSGVQVVTIDNFSEIDQILIMIRNRSAPPRVFIGGSFKKNNKNSVNYCRALGTMLADGPMSIISGAGSAGMTVSGAFYERLVATKEYEIDRITFCAEANEMKKTMVELRAGNYQFFGNTRTELRKHMISQCRAVICVGGENGTKEEASIADDLGIPVIPVGFGGGYSAQRLGELQEGKLRCLLRGKAMRDEELKILSVDPFAAAKTTYDLLSEYIFI